MPRSAQQLSLSLDLATKPLEAPAIAPTTPADFTTIFLYNRLLESRLVCNFYYTGAE